jgi:hypothetical protein
MYAGRNASTHVLERVDVAARQRDRDVVAVEDGDPPTGPQYARRLGKHLLRARNMRQHAMHDHRVERLARQRQVATVPRIERQVADTRAELTRLREQVWRRVELLCSARPRGAGDHRPLSTAAPTAGAR